VILYMGLVVMCGFAVSILLIKINVPCDNYSITFMIYVVRRERFWYDMRI